jgi:hypothetical protein
VAALREYEQNLASANRGRLAAIDGGFANAWWVSETDSFRTSHLACRST